MSEKEFTKEDFNKQIAMYAKILGFLLILTGITFVQPLFIPQEIGGTLFLQLTLACIKGFLIVAYYMHLKYESSLLKGMVYFTVGILGIFFLIVGIDSNMDDSKDDMFQISQTTSH